MLISLTGTPGTGKTSVSELLKVLGYKIIDLNKLANDNNLIIGFDEKRNSNIVDIEKLNIFFKSYEPIDTIIIDSHLSHHIKKADKVIILRCSPDKLRMNLEKKGWGENKINENIEAEILDIILSETIELHDTNNIYEIDSTELRIKEVVRIIDDLLKNNFKNIKKYKIGKIDWSEELLKDNNYLGRENGS